MSVSGIMDMCSISQRLGCEDMKVEYNPDRQVTTIEVTDFDFQEATPGTALHLWLELGQAIFNYGNLEVKDYLGCVLNTVDCDNETSFKIRSKRR